MSRYKIYILAVIFAFVAILAYVFSQKQLLNLNSEFSPLPADTQVVKLEDGDTYDLSIGKLDAKIDGNTVAMYAYNDSIPGPVLDVQEGSKVTLNVINNLDEETLVHPHGLRLDNKFDGTDLVQEPMKPGESFQQVLNFPDPGLYWYHPHVREDRQQELGLYGAIIVRPKSADYWPQVNTEDILILDDVLLTDKDVYPFADKANHVLMGRYGNTFLVNGKTDFTIEAQAGVPHRLFLLNASNARPYNLMIDGAHLKLVGSDGGTYEEEQIVSDIVISPSERYIVDVLFTKPGTYTMANNIPGGSNTKLVTIDVKSASDPTKEVTEFLQTRKLRVGDSSLTFAHEHLTRPPDKKLKLNIELHGMLDSGSGGMPCHRMGDGTFMGDCGHMGTLDERPEIEWEDTMGMMNARSQAGIVDWQLVDIETGDINKDINWLFKKGDLVKIRLINDDESAHPMQHPIHFHGQQFIILSRNNIPETNYVYKDSVMVKTGETVDILLQVTNSGKWMAHCHNAEHLEAGMMMHFDVQ